ncbi:MAG: class I SAM-dependent methyltransferase [Candidatus Aminicenantes bacterium]|nr:class I SAM-dependent methyltransferase [Candidatus Aminicenantes bacterium]
MADYYAERLSAERLRRCYEIAPPRVRRYLQAEIDHALTKIRPGDAVLELGCGYGRIMAGLAGKAGRIVGIDTSRASLAAGRERLASFSNCLLIQADAVRLPFPGRSFDAVLCLQNGISAFHVDPERLIEESLNVTKPGGTVLFSSYSDRFWAHRLAWFELQAAEGLVGEIDHEKTGAGRIVCKDGFTAMTFGPEDFRRLTASVAAETEIYDIDDSSIFCEIVKSGVKA